MSSLHDQPFGPSEADAGTSTRGRPESLTRATLKTPKAAAVAGLLFSVLLIVIIWLLSISIPAHPLADSSWLHTETTKVALALNLAPFAGISFLWFIGVLRDRLGEREDRFFATVFFGSALLFLAMLFTSAAITSAILLVFAAEPNELANSTILHFARAFSYNIVNVYAIKMAGVFMFSTSTVAVYTAFAPRWIAILGWVLAVLLLLGSYYFAWSSMVLPLWVMLISGHILVDNFRQSVKR